MPFTVRNTLTRSFMARLSGAPHDSVVSTRKYEYTRGMWGDIYRRSKGTSEWLRLTDEGWEV